MTPVNLQGTVTRFKGNGRKLGYPTANLTTATDLKDGVYFGFGSLAKWPRQPAMIFIGTPTTIGDSGRRVEAHLFDIPDEDYYGLSLSLAICHYYRANQTFGGLPELLAAMRADEAAAREWCATFAARGSSSAS